MGAVFQKIIITVFSSLFLVSCITFEENYYLKTDGSGSFEFKVDMSQLMSMMKAFQGAGQDSGLNAVDGVDFKKEVEKLKAIQGITNVKVVEDKEDGLFSMSFDFSDYEALNKAHREALDGEGSNEVLTKKGNAIFFKQITPADLVKQVDASEMDSLSAMMGAEMLSQFNYEVNFRLEKEVKSVATGARNNYATSNKKSFQLNATVQDIVDKPGLMDVQIIF